MPALRPLDDHRECADSSPVADALLREAMAAERQKERWAVDVEPDDFGRVQIGFMASKFRCFAAKLASLAT